MIFKCACYAKIEFEAIGNGRSELVSVFHWLPVLDCETGVWSYLCPTCLQTLRDKVSRKRFKKAAEEGKI